MVRKKNYLWRYLDRVQFVGKTVWHQTVEILDYSYNNKLPSSESNNKSPKSYKSFCNESMTETNTTKPTTRSDGSRTNGRKLISPLPSVSANKYKNTRHESKCKVSRSFYILN